MTQEKLPHRKELCLQSEPLQTGAAAIQSFDCTKYNRYGFTAKGQDCANVETILCQPCFFETLQQ